MVSGNVLSAPWAVMLCSVFNSHTNTNSGFRIYPGLDRTCTFGQVCRTQFRRKHEGLQASWESFNAQFFKEAWCLGVTSKGRRGHHRISDEHMERSVPTCQALAQGYFRPWSWFLGVIWVRCSWRQVLGLRQCLYDHLNFLSLDSP